MGYHFIAFHLFFVFRRCVRTISFFSYFWYFLFFLVLIQLIIQLIIRFWLVLGISIYLLLVLLSIIHGIHIIWISLLWHILCWIKSLSLSLHLWLLILLVLWHLLLVTHHLLPILRLRISHVGLISLSFHRLLVVAYVSLLLSTWLINLRLLFFGDQLSLVLFSCSELILTMSILATIGICAISVLKVETHLGLIVQWSNFKLFFPMSKITVITFITFLFQPIGTYLSLDKIWLAS